MVVSKSKTIVVIDDDPAVLQAYGRLLRRAGYRVVLVGDAGVARRDGTLLGTVDLLILDQRMPGMTGLELLTTLGRCNGAGGASGPPVLLISAYLDGELRRAAARLGVAEVIEKPVNTAHLLRCVRAALSEEAAGSAA